LPVYGVRGVRRGGAEVCLVAAEREGALVCCAVEDDFSQRALACPEPVGGEQRVESAAAALTLDLALAAVVAVAGLFLAFTEVLLVADALFLLLTLQFAAGFANGRQDPLV
jgi:hypothetical protein